MNVNKINQFISMSLYFINILHQTHWTTNSYAQHISTDNLITQYRNLLDIFVETCVGQNISLKKNIKIQNLSENYDVTPIEYIQDLNKMIKYIHSRTDSSIQNVLDEMTSELNKFVYLSSFQ